MVTDGVAEVCFEHHDSTRRRTVSGLALRASTTSGRGECQDCFTA